LGGGYRLLRSVGLAPTKGKLSYHTNRLVDLYRVNRKFVALHTNGCGDFTLLDRDTWFRLRGYPEWPMFSWGIDSIFLFQADANKIPIRKLSSTQCTYHIDHGGGWTPEAQAALFGRLAEKGIAFLSEQDFYRLEGEMNDRTGRGASVVYNADNWGLADEFLQEKMPTESGGMVLRPNDQS